MAEAVHAGTTAGFFLVTNILRVGPWRLVAHPTPQTWWLTAFCALFCPLGAWLGWVLHSRLDEKRLYLWSYGLLVPSGAEAAVGRPYGVNGSHCTSLMLRAPLRWL